jgi:hypothetical protein
MRSLLHSLALLLVVGGCEIEPQVIGAQITSDPGKPDQLADITVDVQLNAHPFTNDRALLDRVTLSRREGYAEQPAEDLALGFPSDFNPWVSDDQPEVASLVNLGTTNRDLADICGQTVDLAVWVGRDGDRDGAAVSPPYTLEVNCPGLR